MIDNFEKKVKQNINYWKGDIKAIQKNIDTNNFNDLLLENCQFSPDIFSIDIDGVYYFLFS